MGVFVCVRGGKIVIPNKEQTIHIPFTISASKEGCRSEAKINVLSSLLS